MKKREVGSEIVTKEVMREVGQKVGRKRGRKRGSVGDREREEEDSLLFSKFFPMLKLR